MDKTFDTWSSLFAMLLIEDPDEGCRVLLTKLLEFLLRYKKSFLYAFPLWKRQEKEGLQADEGEGFICGLVKSFESFIQTCM